MSKAEEWANALGEEIKANRHAVREDERMVAMQRDIVAEKMPLKWDEVCASFQRHCTAYNEQVHPERKLVFALLGKHQFMIRPDALGEIVIGQYYPQTKAITIQTPVGTEWFKPKVMVEGSGSVELVSSTTQSETDPDSIAQAAIREGLVRK